MQALHILNLGQGSHPLFVVKIPDGQLSNNFGECDLIRFFCIMSFDESPRRYNLPSTVEVTYVAYLLIARFKTRFLVLI